MRISPEASRKIENMSLLCAVLIVTIHVGWSRQVGSVGWYVGQLVQDGIARVAVPFFFVVSGFFLSAHFDEPGWWKRETGKRMRSLLAPFFLWIGLSVLVICPINAVSFVGNVLSSRPWGTYILWAQQPMRAFGLDLTEMPICMPLWYLRCLFLFVVMSPFVKWFLDKCPVAWTSSVFALALAHAALAAHVKEGWMGLFEYGVSVRGLVYFSVGMAIGSFGISWTKRTWALGALAAFAGLIWLRVWLAPDGDAAWLAVLRDVSIPFGLYGLWHFMPARALPSCLRGCSFPVYLMHMLFVPYWRLIFKHSPIALGDMAKSLILLTTGVVVPIVLCHWLRSRYPRVAKTIFCGR